MSSRPPGQDRFSQMSDQAAIIAQKKAEIEAKLKAASDGRNNSSGNNLGGNSFNKSGALGKNSKNRWGFKGKRSNPQDVDTAKSESSLDNSSDQASSSQFMVKNQFSNDGSFLEQFKKMKETPVPASIKNEPVQVKEEKKPVVNNTQEQEEWYKNALARAKQIAQNMSAPSSSNPSIKSEIKSEPSNEPSGSEYGNSLSQPASTSSHPDHPNAGPMTSSDLPSSSIVFPLEFNDDDLPIHVSELASMVAVSGDQVEAICRARNVGEEALAFLFDWDSPLYKKYRIKVEILRRGVIAESTSRKEDAADIKAKRKSSRWGDENDKVAISAGTGNIPGMVLPPGMANPAAMNQSPQLMQYAIKVFGTTDLEESQWKQCEDQLKMNQVYNALLMKKKQNEIMAMKGQRKYEYDSDEDIEGGTWEHKARKLEMEKTQEKAVQLTEAASGKHHIGDFLPPEELTKFMNKFEAIKTGETFVDETDYAEQKLTQKNLGFKMLQRMGWSEGKGLGSDGQGITAPINQGQQGSDKKGLGTITPHNLQQGDDEFEAYRKRMMMAYRFRPNPLNNPRRAYY